MRFLTAAAVLLATTATTPLIAPQAAAAAAVQPCTPESCYEAGALRKDLLRLHRKLPTMVHNLYAQAEEEEFEEAYAEARRAILTDMPKAKAHLLFQRYLTTAQMAHLKTDALIADAITHFQEGGRVLPFNIRVVDDGLLVTPFLIGSDTLPNGSIITSINGEATYDVLDRMGALIAADTEDMVYAIAEQGFPFYYYLLEGEVSQLQLDIIRPDGTKASIDYYVGGTIRDMEELGAGVTEEDPDAVDFSTREVSFPGNGIAYLRPGPFGNIEGEPRPEGVAYDPTAFEAFLTDAFDRIAAEGSTDLLIDLRDNPGGDNSFSDLLVARIADKPFRWASRFEVRASAENKARVNATSPEPGSLSAQMKDLELATADGAIYSVELPEVAPRADNRFDGRVWVLVDRHSYSNAVVTAATLQDHGFATVLGEETRDVATTFGSAEQFTLPETGIVVTYPKSFIVRPSGLESDSYIEPDEEFFDLALGREEADMLERAIAEIEASR
ncbi:S41 family peptidase [Sphingomicrobium aestuariivivum]|uniref:S41 family peptidase n=1 Tax=Sphingomicrobium aestuariivivum TaxID=1582356 RepID=UPI001FD69552|nr:S41 family peptidase [Sphingomicrobium aestuariivivum]MCJ8189903.1 S41 family peptidase [Sphingomicrobium aestuariivivum]